MIKAVMCDAIKEILASGDERAYEKLIQVSLGNYGYDPVIIVANNVEYEVQLLNHFKESKR